MANLWPTISILNSLGINIDNTATKYWINQTTTKIKTAEEREGSDFLNWRMLESDLLHSLCECGCQTP